MIKQYDFDQIYMNNYVHVKNFCRNLHMKINEQDIEDIFQNTFIKVFKNLDRFDSKKSSIKTWICNIAKNEAIDRYRQAVKNRTFVDIPFDSADIKEALSKIELRIFDINQYLQKEQQDFEFSLKKIREAISQLSNDQKVVLDMHYGEGLKFREIAKIIKTTKDAAHGRADRGLIKVRQILGVKKIKSNGKS